MRQLATASLALAWALTACDSSGPDAPGGLSEGEARALDAAAEMLDQRRLPAEALPPEAAVPAAPAAPAEMTGDTGAANGKDTPPAP